MTQDNGNVNQTPKGSEALQITAADKKSSAKYLASLLYYCPTGTTEGEQHILRDAFIRTDEYAEMMTPPPYSPRILVGKKGSGKSAVIDFWISILNDGKIPCLHLKPLDIELGEIPARASVGELTRIAYDALLRAIGAKIGSDISGFLGESDKVLYEEAIRSGHQSRDYVEKLAKVLASLAKPWTHSDLTKVLPNSDKSTRSELEDAIIENLSGSERALFLFIDDTDQVASPDQGSDINRIWALLLATRELSRRVGQLRCIVTLRDEVWRRLTTHEAGQRDQTDHFTPLLYRLNPTREHIKRIIERRLRLAANKAGTTDVWDYYSCFFQGADARMPSSQKSSSWADILLSRTRDRPRDAIQLINALAKHAKGRRDNLINEHDLHNVMPIFSEERVSFASQELEAECREVREIIRSVARMNFDAGSFRMTNQSLRDQFKKVPSQFSLCISGHQLRPDNEQDSLTLLGFLYEVGIITARVSDSTKKDNYRFVSPDDDPTLVSKARWNDLQSVIWEVNPVFRDYMIKVERERRTQIGLPGQRPRRSRPK